MFLYADSDIWREVVNRRFSLDNSRWLVQCPDNSRSRPILTIIFATIRLNFSYVVLVFDKIDERVIALSGAKRSCSLAVAIAANLVF